MIGMRSTGAVLLFDGAAVARGLSADDQAALVAYLETL